MKFDSILADKKLNIKEYGRYDAYSMAGNYLFYLQLGVKLCSMEGSVQKIYMVFLKEPSRRDRSGNDLFHLRDGFEIKMNLDRSSGVPAFAENFPEYHHECRVGVAVPFRWAVSTGALMPLHH